jgi:hypothetical protein
MRPTQAQLPDGDLEPLLKELIDQGLSITAAAPTQNRADSEAARYHVLLKVLSQACVSGFVSWLQIPGIKKESELESKKQQAAYTITILSRQIEVRPELLVSTAPDEPDTPLYKWLLPCVINSAGDLRMLEGCNVLADGLISVAVCIVRALGTDLACDDDTVNYGRGAVRLRECLCALQNCLKGEFPTPSTTLMQMSSTLPPTLCTSSRRREASLARRLTLGSSRLVFSLLFPTPKPPLPRQWR